MVTIYSIKSSNIGEKNNLMVELRGLSTDTKPTELENGLVANGSVFIEIDTQDVYIYDGENKEWVNPDIDEQSDNESNKKEEKEIVQEIEEKEILDNIEER